MSGEKTATNKNKKIARIRIIVLAGIILLISMYVAYTFSFCTYKIYKPVIDNKYFTKSVLEAGETYLANKSSNYDIFINKSEYAIVWYNNSYKVIFYIASIYMIIRLMSIRKDSEELKIIIRLAIIFRSLKMPIIVNIVTFFSSKIINSRLTSNLHYKWDAIDNIYNNSNIAYFNNIEIGATVMFILLVIHIVGVEGIISKSRREYTELMYK